jgi:hypothetical protein
MNQNKVSAALSDTDAAVNMTAPDTIRQKLPFLVDLTPEEKVALLKMGDKRRSFVRDALTVAQQNPDILPRAFNVEEFARDVALERKLAPVAAASSRLAELVDDTLVAVGSDAYMTALAVYQVAKVSGNGVGLDAQLDALGQRFARKTQPASPTPSPAR